MVFQDISLSIFAHFPSISIKLNNLSYYEYPQDSTNNDELPIASIEEIYVAFNVIDLIGGKINVPKVSIAGGSINIVTYADSSINLFNAFGKEKPGSITVTEDIPSLVTDKNYESIPEVKDSLESYKSSKIDLSVDGLTIQNIKLSCINPALKRNSSFKINELNASFIYREKRILSELNTDIDIEYVRFPERIILNENHINLKTSLSFDEENNNIEIKPS